MRKLLLLAVALALFLPASASAATPAEVLRDCTDNGKLDKSYTLAELVAGFRSITADQRAYGGCEAILTAAINARGDVLDCKDFTSQQDAQVFLTPGDPSKLDPDKNGLACENLPNRPDVPVSTPGSAGTPLTGQPGAPAGGSGPGGIVLPSDPAVNAPGSSVGTVLKGDRVFACGNYSTKRRKYVKNVRRATAFTVTTRNVKCVAAGKVVQRLKTFKRGKRKALGYSCRARKTIGVKNRKTIRCAKPRRRVVTWLVRV